MKKLFPLSWSFANSIVNFILGIVVYLAIGLLAGLAIAFVGSIGIPVLAWILRVLAILVDVYVLVGVVMLFLVFFKVVK